MVRKTQMIFKLVVVGTDVLSVLFAVFFFSLFPLSLLNAIVLVFSVLVSQSLLHMYQLDSRHGLFVTTSRSVFSSATAIFTTIVLFGLSLSVADILSTIVIAAVAMTVLRTLVLIGESEYYRSGKGRVSVLLIGMSRAGEAVLKQMKSREDLSRIHILGFLDNTKKESVGDVQWLGKLVDLERVIQEVQPVAVIQMGQPEQLLTVTTLCQRYNLEYHVLPSLIGAFGRKVDVSKDAGVPLIKVKETNMHGWGFVQKRVFDLVGSIVLFIAMLPVMLLIAVVVMIERRDINPFTKEPRVDGRTGRSFNMRRFKTLQPNEEEYPLEPHEIRLHHQGLIKDKGIDRATKLGRFLRKTELHELPQLINVLKNEMSLVGPRPPFEQEVPHYTNFHQKRLRLKPGITGVWQIEKEKTDGTHDALLKKDIFYVENWSVGLDVFILLKTGGYVIKKLFV